MNVRFRFSFEIGVVGKDETVADSTSWRNPMEANKVKFTKSKLHSRLSIEFVHISIELGGISGYIVVPVGLHRR